MNDTAAPETRASPAANADAIAVALFAFVAACAIYAALMRGVWIDELWSSYLGDATIPFSEYFHRRLLHEVNPMTANSLYRLVAIVGITDTGWSRIALNLPGLALLVAASFGFTRHSPSRSPFYLTFAILIVALPAFVSAFADFRSYSLQLCWGTILLQYLYWLIAEGRDPPMPLWLKTVSFASVAGSVILHFLTGIIVSTTIGVALLYLAREGRWVAFKSVAMPAGLAWLTMLVLAAWQYSHFRYDLDHSWITTTPAQAAMMAGATVATALLTNPIATGFALVGDRGSTTDAQAERALRKRFVLVLMAGLMLSGSLMFAINSLRPMLVARYLVFWQLVVCAVVAAFGARAVFANRLRLAALAGVAGVWVAMTSISVARERNWEATRDYIAASVQSCPSTRVYAMSVWEAAKERDTRYAALERPTIVEGYRRLAREADFSVTIVDRKSPPLDLGTACPTLLWVEHLVDRVFPDANAVLAAGGLRFDRPARLGWFRTGNGLVVIARPLLAKSQKTPT